MHRSGVIRRIAENEHPLQTGRDAITHYRVLERFGAYTFIECRLETGRTHQIRVHMASIGHPLLGDEVYGPARQPFSLEGQTLHAGVLGFIHPRTGEYVEFSAPLPAYFEELLEKLRKKLESKSNVNSKIVLIRIHILFR